MDAEVKVPRRPSRRRFAFLRGRPCRSLLGVQLPRPVPRGLAPRLAAGVLEATGLAVAEVLRPELRSVLTWPMN